MASGCRAKRQDDEKKCLDVEFDGILESSVRAILVIEMIKYIVYQRQQIPLPFDQIKRDVEKTQLRLDQASGPDGRPPRRCPQQSEHRKTKLVVDSLDELFSLIKRVFADGGPIKQVVVLLGSTLITPKEVLILHFPTAFYEGPMLPLKSCISSLFKTVVTGDFECAAQTMSSSTKLTVLMEASRHCDFSPHRMLYKPHFAVPTRGQCLEVSLHCTSSVAPADLSRLDEADINISGIESLPMYTPRVSPGGASSLHNGSCQRSTNSHRSSRRGSYGVGDRRRSSHGSLIISNHDGLYDMEQAAEDEAEPVEYVWYQFPVTVKGYVNKMS